ncbi:unnamed protein product, partial [Ectocarpus sp. 12 AP-2014]
RRQPPKNNLTAVCVSLALNISTRNNTTNNKIKQAADHATHKRKHWSLSFALTNTSTLARRQPTTRENMPQITPKKTKPKFVLQTRKNVRPNAEHHTLLDKLWNHCLSIIDCSGEMRITYRPLRLGLSS